VTFAIGSGEIAVLCGPSGAGKTLLLRAIADLEPHQGNVCLDGCSLLDMEPPQWRRQVAMLPAESQWWRARVIDHFQSLDDRTLHSLDLPTDIVQRPVALLSSGESQRLALLRLFQNQPRVVLLDEPTASLDQSATHAVEMLVKEYARKTGACVLWVSHSADQMQRLAGLRFELSRGQLTGTSGHAKDCA